MGKKYKLDYEELRQYYIIEDHTYVETYAHFGLNSGGVLDRALKKYGLKKLGKTCKMLEEISEERIRELFIEQNRSGKETAKELKITVPQLRVLLQKYSIHKDKQAIVDVTKRVLKEKYGVESNWARKDVIETRKKNFIEKHGVSNPFLLPEVLEETRKRHNSEEMRRKRAEGIRNRTSEQKQEATIKQKQTCIGRFGEDYQKIFTDRMKETYIQKYGVPYSIEGHEKARKTCLERYGTEVYANSVEGRERVKATKFEKYGGYFNLEKVRETKQRRYGDPNYNNRDKARETNLERHGVEWFCLTPECQAYNIRDSKPNRAFATLLDEAGIAYEREFPIEERCYDFRVGKTLIEINPYATHNSTWGIKGNKKGKFPDYHYHKAGLAASYGFNCINVWDWIDPEKVISYLKRQNSPETIDLLSCVIQEVEQKEALEFIRMYGIQSKQCIGKYNKVFRNGEESIALVSYNEDSEGTVLVTAAVEGGNSRVRGGWKALVSKACSVDGFYILWEYGQVPEDCIGDVVEKECYEANWYDPQTGMVSRNKPRKNKQSVLIWDTGYELIKVE